MSKGGKLLLKPGFLATHVIPDCERIRNERIKRNNRICDSLGVKGITPPSEQLLQQKCAIKMQLLQQKRANENGKRGRDELDDRDYIPSNDEDDHANGSESIDSFEQAMQTPPSGQTAAQSQREPQSGATMESERVTRSTLHSDMDTQVLLPLVDQPQSEAVPSGNVEDAPVTKGRGRTKGLAQAKFRGRGEKVKLGFSRTLGRPMSENNDDLTMYSTELGIIVRQFAPLQEKSWEAVSQDAKEMFIAHIREKFDLPEAPYVNRAILRAMGRRYCDNRSRLKKKFDKGIVICPEHIEEADWTYLCNLWQDTIYVGKCDKYKASRSKPRIHHVAGSKPFYKVKNDMIAQQIMVIFWGMKMQWSARWETNDVLRTAAFCLPFFWGLQYARRGCLWFLGILHG